MFAFQYEWPLLCKVHRPSDIVPFADIQLFLFLTSRGEQFSPFVAKFLTFRTHPGAACYSNYGTLMTFSKMGTHSDELLAWKVQKRFVFSRFNSHIWAFHNTLLDKMNQSSVAYMDRLLLKLEHLITRLCLNSCGTVSSSFSSFYTWSRTFKNFQIGLVDQQHFDHVNCL